MLPIVMPQAPLADEFHHIRPATFRQITLSRSLADCEGRASLDLFSALFPFRKGVRLLGVTPSSLNMAVQLGDSQSAPAR
ncbi:MAG TPA: hypothetical protein VHL98_18640 [Microvirga sp.]|jgi:hypothetical protein|nr:hypothetical protein [Microvirga sp.]